MSKANESILCLADNTEHPTLEAMHKHLQHKLKLKQSDYYPRYHPRADRLTKEPIPFKSVEQYLSTEFLSKDTLRRWIAANPEAGRQWAFNWLKRRKEEKNLILAPTQVELRSLTCPSMHYYETLAGGYVAAAQHAGLVPRFVGELAAASLPPRAKILVDTREQAPLKLTVSTEAATLPYGDYTLDAGYSTGVYIERKSLSDFAGTLSDREVGRQLGGDSNLSRFARELERAKEAGAYIVVLVEDTIDNAMELGTSQSRIPAHGKVTGAHLFHNLRELLRRFDHFQALFVPGRQAAANAVVKLLALGASVKDIDLQFQLERGALKV